PRRPARGSEERPAWSPRDAGGHRPWLARGMPPPWGRGRAGRCAACGPRLKRCSAEAVTSLQQLPTKLVSPSVTLAFAHPPPLHEVLPLDRSRRVEALLPKAWAECSGGAALHAAPWEELDRWEQGPLPRMRCRARPPAREADHAACGGDSSSSGAAGQATDEGPGHVFELVVLGSLPPQSRLAEQHLQVAGPQDVLAWEVRQVWRSSTVEDAVDGGGLHERAGVYITVLYVLMAYLPSELRYDMRASRVSSTCDGIPQTSSFTTPSNAFTRSTNKTQIDHPRISAYEMIDCTMWLA
ncbi:unnamed protein product, partial [Prorocentrum cordatum]